MPPGPDPANQPLLHVDGARLGELENSGDDIIDCHIAKIHGEETNVFHVRRRLQAFFASKWGHYFVIVLVSMDITCIFADFLIKLHVCEHTCAGKPDVDFDARPWTRGVEVLGVMSLLFSSLFMLELLGSVFAFGPSYFKSTFHVFDAIVIVVAFVIDLLLRGPLEEAGSLIIVLRLWRVFKIIEEFSAGAADELEEMAQHVVRLEDELELARKENDALRRRLEGDGNGRINTNR